MRNSIFIFALALFLVGGSVSEAAASLPKKPGKHKSHKKSKKKKSKYFYNFQH